MSKSIIARAREMKTMVANAQRSHAKDWLDDHGYNFKWHDDKGELVLVQPAKHNASVLLRPDEVLSKDELKDMYKFILNHQKLSAKGGGGLGLVDIARKTGNKLEYTFQHYQDDYYFFNLDVFITEDN